MMHYKIHFFLFYMLLVCCKEEPKKIEFVITESEIYSLMNDYFIKEIRKTDSLFLFNVRQLKSPDIRLTKISDDDISLTNDTDDTPFPIYSKNNWNMSALKGVTKMYPDKYMPYFESDHGIESGKKWDSIYDFHYMHNVSQPIYNPVTRIAIIKDYPYKPMIWCGTNPYKRYYYQRTQNNSWKRIR